MSAEDEKYKQYSALFPEDMPIPLKESEGSIDWAATVEMYERSFGPMSLELKSFLLGHGEKMVG